MYSLLNAEMVRAHKAELTQGELLAQHRRALRELRGPTPRRGRQVRRLVAVTGTRPVFRRFLKRA
jgi:hypothetical protein